ncbi:MAG: sigma-70 family RNA polymerase sigma factor [Thermodesulfobacteriota bacterium]
MKEEKQDLHPEIWIQDHGDYLLRYALLRLRNKQIAEDVVQETFLAALKGKDEFRGQASERTWLVGILKHKLTDYFRKSSRESPVTDLVASEESAEDFFDRNGKWKVEPGAWGDDPAGVLEKKEFWKTFKECLAGLPKRLADVFSLREFEGLETEEIRNLMGLSTTNLNVQLYRARLRLARCLNTNWFEKIQKDPQK